MEPTDTTTAITTTPGPPAAAPRKKRRWKILAAIALVMIAVPLAYWFIAGWMSERELAAAIAEIDADDPNWRWPDLVAELKPPPDDANAMAQVVKVHALLKTRAFVVGPRFENDKAVAVRNARLSRENVAVLRAAFQRLDPECLKEARKLKDLPDGRLFIPVMENPFQLLLSEIQQSREVMNLLSHDAMLRGQDDPDGAAESCLALIHTAHSINDHPTLIAQLVRMAGQAISVSAVERLLGQGEVSEPKLAALQAALQREADANSLYLGMRGEMAGTHQVFVSVRAGKTSLSEILNGGRTTPNSGFEARMTDAFAGLILRGEAEHLRLMHENIKASKLDETEQPEAFRKLEQKVRQSRDWTIRLLMPAVTKVHEASLRTKAYLRSACCGIAAERYRQQRGAWPDSLSALAATGLIKDVPKDPYDGKPLRWRRTPTGAVVYSVGPDKTDDGGKLDRANPLAKASDYGFELFDARAVAPPAVEEAKPRSP